MISNTNTNTNTAAAEPTTEPSSAFVSFVLRQLNCARLEALLAANEIATTATALSGGLISAEVALLILHETGLAELIPTSSAA